MGTAASMVGGTLFTYPDNFRAQKAEIAAKYSGAKLTVSKDFKFGETNKSAEFLKKFPLGKVPAFEGSDGTLLTESNAIAWDAVVLQDQSQRPSFGAQYVYNYILPDVLTLVQTMKETNVCTLPVFFQTWGKRDGDTHNCSPAPYDALCTYDGVQDQLTQAYNTMAYVSQPAKVAPAK